MKYAFGLLICGLVWVSCAGAPHSTGTGEPLNVQEDRRTDLRIRRLLDQSGPQLDHPVLMEVYAAMSGADRPIAHIHPLMTAMIHKRNENPRIDQMILIFSAKAIGESRFLIPDVGGLFESILDQEARLNEWVISFVADAIARYPYEIPQGDPLVDRLESVLARIRNTDDPDAEIFGFHFMPPPRHALIRSYLGSIKEQRIREQERNRYYLMIRRNVREDDIATSMAYLQSRAQAGAGPPCPLVMKCLLKMQDQIPLK